MAYSLGVEPRLHTQAICHYYTQRGWHVSELLGKKVFVIENKTPTKIFGIKEDE